MFINFSNHPSSKWSEKQTTDALILGGEIVDVPFPNVPPNADPNEIMRLAYLAIAQFKRIAGAYPENTFVMIQGEPTLCFAIISRLQIAHSKIRAVAATTERVVIENADGSKTASFNFVQFRKYV